MANARARLGKAMRSMVKRKKTTGVVTGALGALGTVAAFGAGQAKKADTAWKEYEAGYKELGGDVADIPKRGGFFKQVGQTLMPGGDKGFFQMPEGDVTINKKIYDRSKIQEAGSFLGSDAAAVLDVDARTQYLKRTVPGREIPTTPTAVVPQNEEGLFWQSEGVSEESSYARFARGGDFITNGPQQILVGDNPGGRERVTVKPLSSKDDAEFGRNGDDAMKIIDGQPAHINEEIEGDMSPEDIKKYGAGTINPITGKKEYFLGTIAAGLAIGSSLYKGYQAMQNQGDVAAGQQAAGDIKQEQLDFLGDVRSQTITGTTQQAQLGYDAAQSQFAGGQRDLTMGTQTGMRDIQAGAATAASRSGLATSGTIEQQTKTQTGDLMARYKSDMTKLFETKDLAAREKGLAIETSTAKADLAFRSGEMSAEEAYQSTLTDIESQPTGFWEGVFS